MCAFLDPRAEVAICGKTTQARQNGPGARPGASSILGVAYTISMHEDFLEATGGWRLV
jgi:hypothetical protein